MKRLLTAAAVVALLLAGCGDSSDDTGTASATETAVTATVEPSPTPEPEPEPSLEPDPTPEDEGTTPTPAPAPDPEPEPATLGGVAAQVRDAVLAAYGDIPGNGLDVIISYSNRDAPRVTVATTLGTSDAGIAAAYDLCMLHISVSDQITAPFTGVYITAGEGGPFLAECDSY